MRQPIRRRPELAPVEGDPLEHLEALDPEVPGRREAHLGRLVGERPGRRGVRVGGVARDEEVRGPRADPLRVVPLEVLGEERGDVRGPLRGPAGRREPSAHPREPLDHGGRHPVREQEGGLEDEEGVRESEPIPAPELVPSPAVEQRRDEPRFMMLQIGLGAFALATLHVVGHSFYKAHAFASSASTVRGDASPPRRTSQLDLVGIGLGLLAGMGIVGALVLVLVLGVDIERKP